jgi:hypothetical protein
MWSQNLESHRWKHRVIVIHADEKNSKLADLQYEILEKLEEQLTDRKIVIYKCIAGSCLINDWKRDSKIIQSNNKAKGFSVVLVGLDGYQKFESNKVEQASVFFELIDTMPMRRQELKKRNIKNE